MGSANAKLGPAKRINLICIGYPSGTDPSKFDAQVAYWHGGKKNDFIIGFADQWARVYSWSESELAKVNISTIFLNPSDPHTLAKIEDEIRQNYTKVDWSGKFKYLSINPQMHHIIWYVVVLVFTQIILYVIFHTCNIRPK